MRESETRSASGIQQFSLSLGSSPILREVRTRVSEDLLLCFSFIFGFYTVTCSTGNGYFTKHTYTVRIQSIKIDNQTWVGTVPTKIICGSVIIIPIREAAALLYLIALLFQIINKNKKGGEERFRLATI